MGRSGWFGLAVIALGFAGIFTRVSAADGLVVWPVDPHVKVLRNAEPPQSLDDSARVVRLRAARNEYEPGQIVVRSERAVAGVRVEFGPLRHVEAQAAIEGSHLAWNFVGYIHLTKNTPDSELLRIATAPCDVPDPLLEARTLELAAGVCQPVWLTVYVPPDALPGVYRGEVAVMAGQARIALPVELVVDPWTLPDGRHILVTNWFSPEKIAKAHGLEPWSEAHWDMLGRYAQNMAAHRQNVVLTPWTLIGAMREPDGALSFDYSRFDRFVELFQRAGVADRIELSHVGHGEGGWGGKIVLSKLRATDRATGKAVTLEFAEGLGPLLADLQRHLAQRGWLEKALLHVADEPSIQNVASWREASTLVHSAAPGLRRIDAIETIEFSGALEVWVPKLSQFDAWREAFEAHRADGEFWYYICCHPFGNVYPNRFLDYPASSVRVLHRINYAADLAGYLHWGWNFWGNDPFGTPSDQLPPGDTHVVYPGATGPINSIRWEIQRESLEDFEYLYLLEAKTAEVRQRLGQAAEWVRPRRRAMELCRRIVPRIDQVEKDPARILDVRRQIAEEIIALEQTPLALVETEPADGAVLVHGPINLEVRGVVEPGTEVKLHGRTLPVGPDGHFASRAWPQGPQGEVRIEVQRDGQRKTIVRHFTVRRQ